MNTSPDYEEVLKLTADLSLDNFHSTPSNESLISTEALGDMFSHKYQMVKELYKSPNSSVYLVNLPSDSGSPKNNSNNSGKDLGAIKVVKGQVFNYLLEKEHKILCELDHPNIIKALDYCPPKNDDGLCSYLCVPYYEKGELFEQVKSLKGLGEPLSCQYMGQICSAVEYLHNLNIAHRDIKLENILIDDALNAQLIDFGFCYKIDKISSEDDQSKDIQTRVLEQSIESQVLGTFGYMAPELLSLYKTGSRLSMESFDQQGEKLEGYKAGDIFSLGVSLFTMVFGIAPFKVATKEDSNYRLLLLGKKSKSSWFWKKHPATKILLKDGKISEDLRSLLEGMLDPEPTERLTINSVLNHPWMKNAGAGSKKEIQQLSC